jgi:hypothetical protein
VKWTEYFRNTFFSLIGLITVAIFSTTALAANKPNVILIITDDMG